MKWVKEKIGRRHVGEFVRHTNKPNMRFWSVIVFVGILMSPSSPSLAQASGQQGWSHIACTTEKPDDLYGVIMTVYFQPSGLVFYNGRQYTGTVSSAEIRFCLSGNSPAKAKVCFQISRTSGRFLAFDAASGTVMAGSCVPGGKPKF